MYISIGLLSIAVLSSPRKESMTFKVLHCLLVFLRRSFCLEGAETSSLTRLRIFFAGIQPVLAGFQLSDHDSVEYSHTEWAPARPLRDETFWAANGQLFHPYFEK